MIRINQRQLTSIVSECVKRIMEGLSDKPFISTENPELVKELIRSKETFYINHSADVEEIHWSYESADPSGVWFRLPMSEHFTRKYLIGSSEDLYNMLMDNDVMIATDKESFRGTML